MQVVEQLFRLPLRCDLAGEVQGPRHFDASFGEAGITGFNIQSFALQGKIKREIFAGDNQQAGGVNATECCFGYLDINPAIVETDCGFDRIPDKVVPRERRRIGFYLRTVCNQGNLIDSNFAARWQVDDQLTPFQITL